VLDLLLPHLALAPNPLTTRELARRCGYPPSAVTAALRASPDVKRIGAGPGSRWITTECIKMSFALYQSLEKPDVVADGPPNEITTVTPDIPPRRRMREDTLGAVERVLVQHGRSVRWIARQSGLDVTTVRTALPWLLSRGVVRKGSRGKWGRA
jgi:DNA-binding transcriptional ArsR family regulator